MGTKLTNTSLAWIFSHTNGSLRRWSQLENIISRYSIDAASHVDTISRCQSLAANVELLGVDTGKEECCNFLAEQLTLLCSSAKGRRYSTLQLVYCITLLVMILLILSIGVYE